VRGLLTEKPATVGSFSDETLVLSYQSVGRIVILRVTVQPVMPAGSPGKRAGSSQLGFVEKRPRLVLADNNELVIE
jgi:hypothetical protein